MAAVPESCRRAPASQSPLFALLLAMYPALFIAANNPGQWQLPSLAVALAIAAAAACGITALLRLFSPSWQHAGLAAAVAVAAFYAYGPVHSLLEEAALRAIERRSGFWIPAERLHLVLSSAAIALIALAAAGLRRVPHGAAAAVCGALNVGALVLLLMAGGQLAFSAMRSARAAVPELPSVAAAATTAQPDIYYIVLDGYARADVLGKYYGFDNAAFLDGLRARGFEVSTAGHANYYWTFLSLASSLNFSYIEELAGDALDAESRERGLAYDLIRRNGTARFLRQRGYRVLHLQSTWGATRINPYADRQLSCGSGPFSDEYLRSFIEASWLKVASPRAAGDLARCHLSNFESLAGVAGSRGPKFMFAHFLLPHHPYLFDRQGRILRTASLYNQFDFQKRLWEQRSAYREQLEYLNGLVLRTIDAIVAESASPPVIVLQSDHGPNLRDGLEFGEQLRIRFANFAAHLLPGAPRGLVPPDGSPVNQFPRIFNHYFRANLPILPERYFYSPFARPYALCEVLDLAGGSPRYAPGDADCQRLPRGGKRLVN